MKKTLLLLFAVCLVVFLCGYFYLYQNHRDVSSTEALTSVSSEELLAVFQDTDIANDKEILDQVILVTGVITSKSANSVILDDRIFVEFDDENYKSFNYVLIVNDTCTIKGRCLGYDDLLEEVKIDQAVLENENSK